MNHWKKMLFTAGLLLFTSLNVFAAKMDEVGLGVYIYDYLLRRCADSWGRNHAEFVEEHFAILEKNGVNIIHLAVESMDHFEKLYLPVLVKHNIKALIQLNYAYFRNGGDWKNPQYMDSMAKKASVFINKYKNHPNVVGFSIREEAGVNQMQLISDYYKNIFKYTSHVDTFICHNNIAAARAHLEPYPEILGTDRYSFFFNEGKNSYLASPAFSINWLLNQAKTYYPEAAKRNADFMMVLTSGGSPIWYNDIENGIKDEEVRKKMLEYADEGNMGWFRLKTGQPAYWKWYKMPANCLKASMWVSVLEGAKYVLFYSYRPMEKGADSLDDIAERVPQAKRRRYATTDFYTLAGHPGKPNPQLSEFAETIRELKVYGKLIMKMKKVENDKTPVLEVTNFRACHARRFTVEGIKGNVTVICNVKVGTWPNGSRYMFKPGDKVKIRDDGELDGYVPRKGEDEIQFEAKLEKGESAWRLDTGKELSDRKVGVKPGSGIMIFTGTPDEFEKLKQITK